MAELSAEVEAQLASLSEAEWSALGARLRAPDTRELLRAEVAKVLGDEDKATIFASWARLEQFVNDKGDIDPEMVRTNLDRIGLIPTAARPVVQRRRWSNDEPQGSSDTTEQDNS